jgi:hypothetical protein
VLLEPAQADAVDVLGGDAILLGLRDPFSRSPKQMFCRTVSQGNSV